HLSHDAGPDATVIIRNVKGNVRVTGWNQNRVQVDGTLGSGAKPLQITGDTRALEIKVESAGGSGWFGNNDNMGPTSLDVHVPHSAALEVHVVSAPVDIDGLNSRSITAGSVSGRVHLGVRAAAVKVDSVSGDVDLSGSARSFEAQTVSGDVLLRAGSMNKVNLGTVSGRIQLDGAVAPDAAWKIDTMSGDVRLNLP